MLSFDRLTVKAGEALKGASEEAAAGRPRRSMLPTCSTSFSTRKKGSSFRCSRSWGRRCRWCEKESRRPLDAHGRVTGGSDPTLSSDLDQVLVEAEKQAQTLGDEYVSTEHFLLGLTVEEGEAGAALREAGATQERVLEALSAVRGGHRVTDQSPEEKYRALERYSRDLTALARQGKLDPVIGRDEEVRRVMKVLARRTKNNPVLIGEPGVGKTAIAEGLAQRIVSGDVPTTLADKRLLALDISAMVAGAKYRGEFEERMKAVLKDITEGEGQFIIFIDELHTIVGAGAAEGAVDAGNMLKPPWPEVSCVWWGRRRSVSTASTSRRMRRSSGGSSRSTWHHPRSTTPWRFFAGSRSATRFTMGADHRRRRCGRGQAFGSLRRWPISPGQGDRPRG